MAGNGQHGRWVKVFTALMLTFTVVGCQRIGRMPDEVLTSESMPSAESKKGTNSPDLSKPFDLLEASIDGDSLRVTVRYGGGCAPHDFSLHSNGPALRSMPPQQLLRIEHRANADPCRALIQENHSFDLSSFRASPHGVMLLRLDEWELTYTYE